MGEEGSKIRSNLFGRKIRKFINVFDRHRGNYYFGKWERKEKRQREGGVRGGRREREIQRRPASAVHECERQRERKTKTGQLAQVTFDMSPAEKWRFFFFYLLPFTYRGTNDVLKNISAQFSELLNKIFAHYLMSEVD